MTGEPVQRTVATPLGPLRLEAGPGGLRRLAWYREAAGGDGAVGSSLLLDRAAVAVAGYFADPHAPRPCLPLAPTAATPFRARVWRAMLAIPPGEVRTYGEVARWLGSSPRAVGGAAGANPWPILVPCHRIVASTGLGGYGGVTAGPGLAIKRWLLAHEGFPAPQLGAGREDPWPPPTP